MRIHEQHARILIYKYWLHVNFSGNERPSRGQGRLVNLSRRLPIRFSAEDPLRIILNPRSLDRNANRFDDTMIFPYCSRSARKTRRARLPNRARRRRTLSR